MTNKPSKKPEPDQDFDTVLKRMLNTPPDPRILSPKPKGKKRKNPTK